MLWDVISRAKSSFSRASMIFDPWRGLLEEVGRYWRLYGGIWAVLLSPFFQLSLILGIVVPQFLHVYNDIAAVTISIVPCLLGFSVGAMAILLAFSSSRIFTVIAEEGSDKSFFRGRCL